MTPQSAVFPTERCMEDVLVELNKAKLTHLWTEDETIGWVYQYFNPPEERKAMREASQAPRNSRELAVRNQFFTPRYVVEFLTDNTLGRIWYEMRKGGTALKDECRYLVRRPNEVFLAPGELAPADPENETDLSQEELLKKPVHIEHRTKKDPRDLRTLDPAVGSGHFLLYAFDLLERIYEEAWLDSELGPALWESVDFTPQVDESHSADVVDPASVRLRPDARPVGEGDCRDLSDCYVVLADLYNATFLAGRPLVYSGAMCEEKKDRILLRIPVSQFSYREAVEKGWFANQTGTIFLELYKDLFTYRMGGPREGMFERLDQAARDDNLSRLRRVIPKLIIEHNLHGIDIDPRAVQIAALALWLRAQKTWKDLGIRATERPRIVKSNIVTAEPMPGEEEMRIEFTAGLKPRVLGQLVDVVFEKMKLAGEAGSLLKIEEEIKDVVAEARKQWLDGPKPEQQLLFPGMADPRPKQQELRFDVKEITDERFWEEAEDLILDALQDYAERAENGHATRRRLFAEDAARGFAFIDLCRKRYDVVLMNPPFGEFSDTVKDYLDKNYEDHEGNLLCGFIARCLGILANNGISGFIIDKTVTIKSSYASVRKRLLQKDRRVTLMIDLGWGVLDGAQVETVSMTVGAPLGSSVTFFRPDISSLQLGGATSHKEISAARAIVRPVSYFLSVPNLALAYDLPTDLLSLFVNSKRCEPDLGDARQGLGISDSWRWYRAISEIPIGRCGVGHEFEYARLTNGGGFAPFFRDSDLTIYWKDEGRAIKQAEGAIYGSWSRTVKNVSYYFREGLSFPKRTDHLNAHLLPAGFIFTVEGLGFFPNQENNPTECSWEALCLFNSRMEAFLINRFCGQHKHVGYVKSLPSPVPRVSAGAVKLCQRAFELKRLWSKYFSNTSLFVVPAVLSRDMDKLAVSFGLHVVETMDAEVSALKTIIQKTDALLACSNTELQRLQDAIDEQVFDTFAIASHTRELIASQTSSRPKATVFQGVIDNTAVTGQAWVFELADYCIGVLFGRWDIRFATGEKTALELPDPFAPLPICPPGMLQNAHGFPAHAEDVLATYPLRVSWDGILVDDPGLNGAQPHRDDIVRRVREVFDLLWKDKAHEIEQEVCEILDVSDTRDYFRKPTGFFQNHLKRYSKSRRKAPIYWPLSTASGSYTIWIYYHRLTDQILYAAVNKYVEPKITEIERGIACIEDDLKAASGRGGTTLTDRLNEARTFLGETPVSCARSYSASPRCPTSPTSTTVSSSTPRRFTSSSACGRGPRTRRTAGRNLRRATTTGRIWRTRFGRTEYGKSARKTAP